MDGLAARPDTDVNDPLLPFDDQFCCDAKRSFSPYVVVGICQTTWEGNMRRREFITLFGGAATAWPLAARAQRQSTAPVIGFLNGSDPVTYSRLVSAFHRGLGEIGFVADRNVTIEYRWAEGRPDRLPALVAELIDRNVAVIVASPTVSSLAAKAATSTIPIVFIATDDPVKLGLVASLNRPGGNTTGVNFLLNELGTKRLELLRALMPKVKRIGLLVNPRSPPGVADTRNVQAAAQQLGHEVLIEHVRSERDAETAFTTFAGWEADAVMVIPDGFVFSLRHQLAAQAARHAMPTIYPIRDFVDAGGLVSYGTSTVETFKQMGNYAGRILKGEKAADLPVVQSAKFELVINLKSAKALGLEIPPTLLALADEVIE